MSIAFRTNDGAHYLCAELDGRVVADRTAVGPWEMWEVEPQSAGVVAIKSAHGKYLCAEPDGAVIANRDVVGPWESWALIQGSDGVALRSSHGYYLVAEQGGGGAVRANRDAQGPWETFTAEGLVPGAVAISPPTRLVVEPNQHYFANASGRFEWREVTAFSLLSRMLRGQAESHVRPWLRFWREMGGTVTRVILTLDGGYWRRGPNGESFRAAPDMPGYWPMLDALAQIHAEEGLYMRACFLGALEPFGGEWDPVARRDIYQGSVRTRGDQFVVEAAQRLGALPHVIGEIANEPIQIGMRESRDAIVALGKKIKLVAPAMLLMGGESLDGDYLCEPFDYADAHPDRDMQIGGFNWVKRFSEYLVYTQENWKQGEPADRFPSGHLLAGQRIKRMPVVVGEPVNYGEDPADGHRNDVEHRPSACFGAAAVTRARRMAGMCFHYDGGLWTTPMQPITVRCAQAFHKALDAFPMLTDGVWRGQWGLGRGDYWKDNWPVDAHGEGTDDPATVEAFVRAGRGAWRAFGCGPYSVVFPQPVHWNWQANLDAPATLVAIETDGDFPSAIYRRT